MRIAVVSNTSWYLFNFRLNLMRQLLASGHSVVAIAPSDAYTQKLVESGINFEHIPISGDGTSPVSELKAVYSLRRTFRRYEIDLVLSYTPKGNIYSALACIALNTFFIPNVSGLGRAFTHMSRVTQLVRLLYRLTFRRAFRVFFQNSADMDFFIGEGIVQDSRALRVPGSGVDLMKYLPFSCHERSSQGSDRGHAANFLLISRILWDKGIGEFVEAAEIVRKIYPEARFQILGFMDIANPSAISREQMEEWVKKGSVEYLGRTDDVRPVLEQADCIVLPSKYREGVPRSLLEAAASSRAIITTDAPGCRDTVLDGISGYLCRLADSADLADKMIRFINLNPDERIEMGSQGRIHMERNFDEGIVIGKYMDVINEVATKLQPVK